jgi:cyanophycin synthetase
LNAADPLVAAMAPKCPGEVIFFALDGANPVIVKHRDAGGRAVFVRENQVILADGDFEQIFIALDRVPLTHQGQITFQVENVLAAIAASWSIKVPGEVIAARLESFAADMDHLPGRFNLFEIRGATVIVDYGHNVSALTALIGAIGGIPHQRRIAVYSTAGDRRDSDIVQQGQMLGAAFDRVILYEDHYIRGRAPGEIIALFQSGLKDASRAREIQEIHGAIKAVQTALDSAVPGDLLMIQADTIHETVDFMRGYLKSLGEPVVVPVAEVAAEGEEDPEAAFVDEAAEALTPAAAPAVVPSNIPA